MNNLSNHVSEPKFKVQAIVDPKFVVKGKPGELINCPVALKKIGNCSLEHGCFVALID